MRMVEYEHDGEVYMVERYAIFDHIWGLVDDGSIGVNTAHRMLGRYFGYPECCIEGFVNPHDKGGLNGERYWCEDCMGRELSVEM